MDIGEGLRCFTEARSYRRWTRPGYRSLEPGRAEACSHGPGLPAQAPRQKFAAKAGRKLPKR
jgi:hypothetical protein